MIQKKKFSDAIAANISVLEGLIGVATSDNDGLLDKNLRNNINISIGNSGSSTNKIFELTGFSGEINGLFAFGRDNAGSPSYILLAFSSEYYSVISKSGTSLKFYYKKDSNNKNRYFISPQSNYGSIVCSLITNGVKLVSFEEVSISESELTVIN